MHRRLPLLAALLATIQFGHGCGSRAKPPDLTIAVTPVSVAKPPAPKLIHGKISVGESSDEIPFTLDLPPGWTWSDGQAEKAITTELTIVVLVTARELPDDEKDEPSSAAARRRLVELPDEKMLNDLATGGKVTIRDRRIIQIDSSDAVWDVVTFRADEDHEPIRMETRCRLKLGNKEFTIDGSHIDTRIDRTDADFDASQAELLKISESFRVDRIDLSPRH